MKIQKQPRKRTPSRRLDLTAMKEALRDKRCWACMGLVVEADAGPHYQLDGDDVLVEVSVMPSEERLTARLGAIAGGAGRGVWAIPAVGTEVGLIIPEGETEFSPIITCTLSTGNISADLDDTILLVDNSAGDIALVPGNDVSLGVKGATERVPRGDLFRDRFNALVTEFNELKTDFNTFVGVYNTHTHATAGIGAPSVPSATGSTSAASGVSSPVSDLSPNVKVN